MNKIQISVLSLLLIGGLFTNTVTAQEGGGKEGGLYIDINLGYHSSLNSQDLGGNQTTTRTDNGITNTTSTRTLENVTGSFGKGMKFGANFGYMFNKNIGAEIGFNYLLGGTTSNEQKRSETYTNTFTGQVVTNTATYTFDLSASMLQINPSFVLTTGNEGIAPYAKFGIVIGTMSKITGKSEEENTNGGSPTTEVRTTEVSGGIALGMSAAVGAKYSLNEKMSLFAELNMINMSYAPTKGETNEHTVNGVDFLTQETTREKETAFVSEIETTNLTVIDDSKPREALKQNYSFSSIGLQVGFRIAF